MDEKDFSSLKVNGTLPDPSGVDANGVVGDLWQDYVDSVSSLLSKLEVAALELESGKHIDENSADIRRILHTIKGDSGVSGIMDIYKLCHQAEFAFEEITQNDKAADMVLKVKDWIYEAINYISQGNIKPQKAKQQEIETGGNKIPTLVIDDDIVCRKRVQTLISEYCDCTFATNGRKGFEKYVQALNNGQPFELVTLDIQMPEMNGHQTLDAIRDFEQSKGISGLDGVKIIMTTTVDESKQIFAAFRKGCEAYVVKNELDEKLLEEMANLELLKTKAKYSVG